MRILGGGMGVEEGCERGSLDLRSPFGQACSSRSLHVIGFLATTWWGKGKGGGEGGGKGLGRSSRAREGGGSFLV